MRSLVYREKFHFLAALMRNSEYTVVLVQSPGFDVSQPGALGVHASTKARPTGTEQRFSTPNAPSNAELSKHYEQHPGCAVNASWQGLETGPSGAAQPQHAEVCGEQM